MDTQNIHLILLQLKTITESIGKIAKGINNPVPIWAQVGVFIVTFILAIATAFMASATFLTLKRDEKRLKEDRKGSYKVFIERIKMYLTATNKIEELTKKIIDKENEKPDFKDWAKIMAANKSLKDTGSLPAGISQEDIKNINDKDIHIQISDNIKLLIGYLERKEEYYIFLNKPQIFSSNIIRKTITLFDFIPQFLNDFQKNIGENKLNEAKIELFWMKLFCIETIMALISEGDFKKEVYYENYTYSDLFDCDAKIIIDMHSDKYFKQNDEAILSLKERILIVIKEFNIDAAKEVEVPEKCKIFE